MFIKYTGYIGPDSCRARLFTQFAILYRIVMKLNQPSKSPFTRVAEKVSMAWWVMLVTLVIPALVFVACTSKRIEPHPESSIPTETKVAELTFDSPSRLTGTETMSAENLQFTGKNTFTEVDNNGDGLFDALQVNIEVKTSASGEYSISGYLHKGDVIIANTPSYWSMGLTHAYFTNGAGTHNIEIAFSGELIFRSGQDGPYELSLSGVGPNAESAHETFITPAIDHTQFGEVRAVVTEATDSAIDSDNDGDFDFIKVAVAINVRVGGDYSLLGDLNLDNGSIVSAHSTSNLQAGMRTVDLQFPGAELYRSGQDGPYSGTVTLLDATDQTLQSLSFTTQAYTSSKFND